MLRLGWRDGVVEEGELTCWLLVKQLSQRWCHALRRARPCRRGLSGRDSASALAGAGRSVGWPSRDVLRQLWPSGKRWRWRSHLGVLSLSVSCKVRAGSLLGREGSLQREEGSGLRSGREGRSRGKD